MSRPRSEKVGSPDLQTDTSVQDREPRTPSPKPSAGTVTCDSSCSDTVLQVSSGPVPSRT